MKKIEVTLRYYDEKTMSEDESQEAKSIKITSGSVSIDAETWGRELAKKHKLTGIWVFAGYEKSGYVAIWAIKEPGEATLDHLEFMNGKVEPTGLGAKHP